MIGATLCSGIGAPECAAPGIDWVASAEISPFPAAVHAFHFPASINLGDMMVPDIAARIAARGPIDVLVAGTPCQAFSVAGDRLSLGDARGNLTLRLCQIVEELDAIQLHGLPALLWENVPGVLNTSDNAFGSFLAGIVGHPQTLEPGPRPEWGKSTRFWSWKAAVGEHRAKWPDAGYVAGPRRTIAWRILDAQFFGLAQRRRRVFAVSCPVGGADPAEILFEWESLRRDTPPSRSAGKAVAALTANGVGTCGADDNQAQAGHLIADPVVSLALRGREGGNMVEVGDNVAYGLRTGEGGSNKAHVLAFGGNNTTGPIDIATAVNAHGGPCGRMDFESETFITQPVCETSICTGHGYWRKSAVSATITGHGANNKGAAPDETMVVHSPLIPILEVGARTGTSIADPRAGIGIGLEGDPMFTLQAGKQHGVAFKASHFTRGKDGAPSEVYPPLSCEADKGDQDPLIHQGMAVRRLMPVECERLQGFPDGYTDIVFKGKGAADGPRFKALGNSMAVPVMTWILDRVRAALEKPPERAGPPSP